MKVLLPHCSLQVSSCSRTTDNIVKLVYFFLCYFSLNSQKAEVEHALLKMEHQIHYS